MYLIVAITEDGIGPGSHSKAGAPCQGERTWALSHWTEAVVLARVVGRGEDVLGVEKSVGGMRYGKRLAHAGAGALGAVIP